jgi:hypothetical protein
MLRATLSLRSHVVCSSMHRYHYWWLNSLWQEILCLGIYVCYGENLTLSSSNCWQKLADWLPYPWLVCGEWVLPVFCSCLGLVASIPEFLSGKSENMMFMLLYSNEDLTFWETKIFEQARAKGKTKRRKLCFRSNAVTTRSTESYGSQGRHRWFNISPDYVVVTMFRCLSTAEMSSTHRRNRPWFRRFPASRS